MTIWKSRPKMLNDLINSCRCFSRYHHTNWKTKTSHCGQQISLNNKTFTACLPEAKFEHLSETSINIVVVKLI